MGFGCSWVTQEEDVDVASYSVSFFLDYFLVPAEKGKTKCLFDLVVAVDGGSDGIVHNFRQIRSLGQLLELDFLNIAEHGNLIDSFDWVCFNIGVENWETSGTIGVQLISIRVNTNNLDLFSGFGDVDVISNYDHFLASGDSAWHDLWGAFLNG